MNHQGVLTYDDASRVSTLSDPNGKTVQVNYDPMNRPASITQWLNGTPLTTQFEHDALGNLRSLTDPNNQRWEWNYDVLDRLVEAKNPLGQSAFATYDSNGNLLAATDRAGQQVQYRYGAADRLTGITYRRADGSTESTITPAYNPATHLLESVADSQSGTYSWVYDALDRVTGESGPGGSVDWTIDELGRRTSLQVPGQGTVTYGYDLGDNLATVTQNGLTSTYVYDALGRLSQQQLPNGVSTEYSFDAAGFLSTLISRQGGVTLDSRIYDRDAVGNILQENANGVLNQYVYDDLYRLTSASAQGVGYAWGYDNVGNRLWQAVNGQGTNYAYDAANRLTSAGGVAATHDANGNLVAFGNDGYGWNVRGEMVSLSRPGLFATFDYDLLGRRASKSVNGTLTAYLYDGLEVVRETTGGANVDTLHGALFDQPIGRGGLFFSTDHLGSPTTLTDGAGNVAQQYQYRPFGETSAQSSGVENPFQFTGRENDGTGLSYYRARYYAPELGRFLSEDPIGFAGGLNQFAYVGNNPINFSDPLGLYSVGEYFSDVGGVFRGYGDALNPVNAYEGLKGLYDIGAACGLGAAASALGEGVYHGFTDWMTTSDPRTFGQSFGTVLMAAGGKAAPFAGRGGRFCFAEGTPVQMADGTTKPIEQVKEGDWVLSRNAATGQTLAKQVVQSSQRQHQGTLALHLSSGEIVETTAEHPFFVAGAGWVAAGQLGIGTAIVTRAGPTVVLERIEHKAGWSRVYNLAVADFHTYFVGQAGGGAWVHNACPGNLGGLMRDAPLKTRQRAVSKPMVDRYLKMLENGQEPPPIKVDGGIIVDGNHRYIAGRIFGKEPARVPGISPSNPGPVVPWDRVFVDPTDW